MYTKKLLTGILKDFQVEPGNLKEACEEALLRWFIFDLKIPSRSLSVLKEAIKDIFDKGEPQFSEAESMYDQLEIGDLVKPVSEISFGQDHAFYSYDFSDPDIVFTVQRKNESNMSMTLVAPGYGQPGNYGNGMITIWVKAIEQLKKVGHNPDFEISKDHYSHPF